jgi:hypothetical protein
MDNLHDGRVCVSYLASCLCRLRESVYMVLVVDSIISAVDDLLIGISSDQLNGDECNRVRKQEQYSEQE